MSAAIPIRQPAADDLRNAAALAVAGRDQGGERADFARIAELIHSALEKLAEPNLSAIDAIRAVFRPHGIDDLEEREARDAAAVVLRAAVSGL